ncbi:MAG: hypothetical protein ABEH47_04145 [Haloferacaceae archaeon]
MSDDPEDEAPTVAPKRPDEGADPGAEAGAGAVEEVEESTAEPTPTGESVAESEPDAGADGSRFRRLVNYGLLAGLLLLALVAAVGFYTAVSSAISTWVTDEWRPLFRAAFNLVVLLLAGSGIAWQARRLT